MSTVFILLVFNIVSVSFSSSSEDYMLFMRLKEHGDLKAGLELIEGYPGSPFWSDAHVLLGKLLLERDREAAKRIVGELELERVSEEYASDAARLWLELGFDIKPLVLRFPEEVPDLIKLVDLDFTERRKVLRKLMARRMYKKVVENAGDDCLLKSQALLRLSEKLKAERILRGCTDPLASIYLMLVYLREGKYREALDVANVDGGHAMYLRLGRYKLANGEPLEALRLFKRAGAGFEALFMAGVASYALGRYRQAYEYFSEAWHVSASKDKRIRATFWKAKSLIDMGERRLGEELLRSATYGRGFFSTVSKIYFGEAICDGYAEQGYVDTNFMERVIIMNAMGFRHYARLEIFQRAHTLRENEIIALKSVDAYASIKVALRVSGANSALYLKTAYPVPYHKIVSDVSGRFSVEESLIYAVMRQESLFNERALSPSGASGLMQIIKPTAIWISEAGNIPLDSIFDLDTNISMGAYYLKYLETLWEGDLLRVLASYNAGPGAVKRWFRYYDDFLFIESIPYAETRKYVRKVLDNYFKYSCMLSN